MSTEHVTDGELTALIRDLEASPSSATTRQDRSVILCIASELRALRAHDSERLTDDDLLVRISDARVLLASHKCAGTELSIVGRLCAAALAMAAELRALRAPVDVEATLGALVDAFVRRAGLSPAPPEAAIVEMLVRPHVERAARMQKSLAEAQSLIASLRKHRNALGDRCEDEHDSLEDARAEIERLKKISDAWKALAQAWNEEDDADAFVGDRRSAALKKLAALSAIRALGIDPEAP